MSNENILDAADTAAIDPPNNSPEENLISADGEGGAIDPPNNLDGAIDPPNNLG
jgi:hypothetical protein